LENNTTENNQKTEIYFKSDKDKILEENFNRERAIELILAMLGIFFILREIYLDYNSNAPIDASLDDLSNILIPNLKFVLIFIALPFLYGIKILSFFNMLPMDDESNLFQAKLFYNAISIILFIIIILEALGKIFK
jgi:hypothetical protein